MTDKPILVCYFEDDPQHREIVAIILKTAGFDVDVCSDGPSALKSIHEKLPDIILADILMPGMNGLETIEKIREMGVTAPVIVLTNFDRHDLDSVYLRELNISRLMLKASGSLDDIVKAVKDTYNQAKQQPDGSHKN